MEKFLEMGLMFVIFLMSLITVVLTADLLQMAYQYLNLEVDPLFILITIGIFILNHIKTKENI